MNVKEGAKNKATPIHVELCPMNVIQKLFFKGLISFSFFKTKDFCENQCSR